VSSVVKWAQRYRRTGSVAPGQMGGHRKPVLEQHRAFILERIRQMPHLTLHEFRVVANDYFDPFTGSVLSYRYPVLERAVAAPALVETALRLGGPA